MTTVPNYQRYVEAALATFPRVPDPEDEAKTLSALEAGQASAFKVLNRAVLMIQKDTNKNVGLLYKPTGNRERDRSADCMAIKMPDGRLATSDCIVSVGERGARPTWQVHDEQYWPSDYSRFRDPYPEDEAPPVEQPPAGQPGDEDPATLVGLLQEIVTHLTELDDRLGRVEAGVADLAHAKRQEELTDLTAQRIDAARDVVVKAVADKQINVKLPWPFAR